MTKRWSSTRSDLTKTKKQASKERRLGQKKLAELYMQRDGSSKRDAENLASAVFDMLSD